MKFPCPKCGKILTAPDGTAGQYGRCKACGERVMVPTGENPQVPPPISIKIQDLPDAGVRMDEFRLPRSTPEGKKILISFDSPQPASGSQMSTPLQLASAAPGAAPQGGGQPKLPMRIRRLMADEEAMRKYFTNSPIIRLLSAEGTPPELYRLEYQIKGLAPGSLGQPVEKNTHLVEIQLTHDYPRQSPKCRVITPIFHPNIDPTAICVGDHWTAQERLIDLTVRIGEMLCFQSYNIQSPLDGEAAMWADLNSSKFPLDARSVRPVEMDR